jgi:hypothetical protein
MGRVVSYRIDRGSAWYVARLDCFLFLLVPFSCLVELLVSGSLLLGYRLNLLQSSIPCRACERSSGVVKPAISPRTSGSNVLVRVGGD